MQYFGSYDQNKKLDIDKLKVELEKIQEKVTIKDTNGEFPIIVTVNKYTFEIDNNGNIIVKDEQAPAEEEIIIKAEDIANSSDKNEYYGATVTGYTCESREEANTWKIFYADKNNIYLISSDYISYNNIPKGRDKISLNKGDTNYKAYFTNIINSTATNKYAGSVDITNSIIKSLNNDYFKKGYSSNNKNMKAVAYMLDTDIWSGFRDINYADYAIGGPTIEMLTTSYNQKNKTNYKVQAISNIGYQISQDGGTNWANYYSNTLNKNDSLYVINSKEKAEGMWLASPTANTSTEHIASVVYGGGFGSIIYNYNLQGFRPIVCLNSAVQLKKEADGNYTIK